MLQVWPKSDIKRSESWGKKQEGGGIEQLNPLCGGIAYMTSIKRKVRNQRRPTPGCGSVDVSDPRIWGDGFRAYSIENQLPLLPESMAESASPSKFQLCLASVLELPDCVMPDRAGTLRGEAPADKVLAILGYQGACHGQLGKR